jgi:hypothetical protein
MAAWADVRKLALALPETVERVSRDGTAEWRVNDKSFVWERPLRRRDHEELGDAAPTGPILGVRVADVGVKEALVAADPTVYFTTSHFDGYPAVLVRLTRIGRRELKELITEAWLLRAPKRLSRAYPPAR